MCLFFVFDKREKRWTESKLRRFLGLVVMGLGSFDVLLSFEFERKAREIIIVLYLKKKKLKMKIINKNLRDWRSYRSVFCTVA